MRWGLLTVFQDQMWKKSAAPSSSHRCYQAIASKQGYEDVAVRVRLRGTRGLLLVPHGCPTAGGCRSGIRVGLRSRVGYRDVRNRESLPGVCNPSPLRHPIGCGGHAAFWSCASDDGADRCCSICLAALAQQSPTLAACARRGGGPGLAATICS